MMDNINNTSDQIIDAQYDPKIILSRKWTTTSEYIYDAISNFTSRFLMNPSPLDGLKIEIMPMGIKGVKYEFRINRLGDFGYIGYVEVIPINPNTAWVNIASYSMLPGMIDDRVEIFEAAGSYLTTLAEYIQDLFVDGELGQSAEYEVIQLGSEIRRPKGENGRPHYPADVWAWEQVDKSLRPKEEVYDEWIARTDVNGRNLIQPRRQFQKITNPSWRPKRTK